MLYKTMVEDYYQIKDDESKQNMLRELKPYFPKVIKSYLTTEGEKLYIDDFKTAMKILESSKSLPEFLVTNKDGIKEAEKKEYSYMQMTKVAVLKQGMSFGEVALIENCKRNATIQAITETHFAVSNAGNTVFYNSLKY